VKAKMDKHVVQLDNKETIKIKNKTKNKPKTEKKETTTKNTSKKDWQQR
jgi:hypothetical protein